MSGTVTVSIEVELGWGVHDTGTDAHLSDDGSLERLYLERLVDHCDAAGIPLSFDIVGHLCHSSCDGSHPGPHPQGWFDADPGTDVDTDPLFYAPDIVQAIQNATVEHELCTHTYSHVICGSVSPETVAWELERSQEQLQELTGRKTVSLVPPRHSPPPLERVRKCGIEIIRMSRDTSDRTKPARAKELLVGPHPTFDPGIIDDVVHTYCTSYPSLTSAALPAGQRAPNGPFKLIPTVVAQQFQRSYLSRALETTIEKDGYCHLWCHLYDLANEYQWPVVRSFLNDLGRLEEAGEIRVLTMAELNESLRSHSKRVVVSQ